MSNRHTGLIVIALFIPFSMITMLLGVVILISPIDEECEVSTTTSAGIDPNSIPKDTKVGAYGHDALVNAAHIMKAASDLGLSTRDQTIGVMTAITESDLVVLDKGDKAGPDSRGLFQQRANGAWGSYKDRMDPYTSATNFFKALKKLANRDRMEPTIAAHKVQVNEDENAYAGDWKTAQDIVKKLSGLGVASSSASTASSSASTKPRYSLGKVQPQTQAAADLLGPKFKIKTIGGYREDPDYPKGHPAGLALDFMINDLPNGTDTGNKLVKYLQDHASEIQVDYILWQQRSWSADRKSWKRMDDRRSPTQNHMDHVHLNLKGTGSASTATGEAEAKDCADTDTDTTPAGAPGKDGWRSPTVSAPITDVFGSPRASGRDHNGVDIGAACGKPVYAAQDGLVTMAGLDSHQNGTIVLDHGGGVKTRYLHMFIGDIDVKVGAKVKSGQQIAKVGNSGQSKGCHLHFVVQVNKVDIDPTPYMKERKITLGS